MTENHAARTLMETLRSEGDPRRRMTLIEEHLRPPEPQLLDTCVLQNLDWVDRKLEMEESVVWDDAAVAELTGIYGQELANDLMDLGILYKEFESQSGYPWLVCRGAEDEVSSLRGMKGERLGGDVPTSVEMNE